MKTVCARQATFVKYFMKTPTLDPDQEAELMHLWKNRGCVASRNRVFEAYSRICIAWARKYHVSGFSHEDLVQEGMLGLASALDRYDPAKGASFGYFASFRIRSAIQNFMIQNMSSVTYKRSGRHKSLAFSLRRFTADLQAKAITEGRHVSANEIHNEASMAFGVPIADIERLAIMLSHKDESLSKPLGENGVTLGDLIVDDNTPDLDELLDRRFNEAEISKFLEESLNSLPDRTRDIIKKRWLSSNEEIPRLEDLATDYGISRERVRQIEADGLKRLRIMMKQYASANNSVVYNNNSEAKAWRRSIKPPRASLRKVHLLQPAS